MNHPTLGRQVKGDFFIDRLIKEKREFFVIARKPNVFRNNIGKLTQKSRDNHANHRFARYDNLILQHFSLIEPYR